MKFAVFFFLTPVAMSYENKILVDDLWKQFSLG